MTVFFNAYKQRTVEGVRGVHGFLKVSLAPFKSHAVPLFDLFNILPLNKEEKCDVTLPWQQKFWITRILGVFATATTNSKKEIDLCWHIS